ncbi:hypothetical protein [Methylobacterium symbioticum]|uniref:hypothetical protein n=1 Tax=Methylobacterium symbioticum TaxID=2584084 RepID=UPI001156D51D|nr:hypothetical protein [Methylobacterium symbioticum]
MDWLPFAVAPLPRHELFPSILQSKLGPTEAVEEHVSPIWRDMVLIYEPRDDACELFASAAVLRESSDKSVSSRHDFEIPFDLNR